MAFTLPAFVKNASDRFSISSRAGMKSALAWGVGIFAAGFVLTSIAPATLAVAAAAALTVRAGASIVRNGTLGDWKHGREVRVWTNDIGQEVKGTRNTQHDLTRAQKSIDRVVKGALRVSERERHSLEKIMKRFNAAAEKTIVTKDIAGNDGRWRYAQKYRQIVVQPMVKAL